MQWCIEYFYAYFIIIKYLMHSNKNLDIFYVLLEITIITETYLGKFKYIKKYF